MNKIRLFFLLRKNTKLSAKRNPMFEANQYSKLFGYIMASILAIEFIALGTFFGWLAAKEDTPDTPRRYPSRRPRGPFWPAARGENRSRRNATRPGSCAR